MRAIVTSFLLLAVAPVIAIAQAGSAPPSAANVVRLHPGPWRMPVVLQASMRSEPEGGESAVFAGSRDALQLMRARAAANTTRRADGSRHAVVGAAFRSWTVATIDAEGMLTQDCVSSAAEAKARVEASAQKQVNR
jgi:hypothetical protein